MASEVKSKRLARFSAACNPIKPSGPGMSSNLRRLGGERERISENLQFVWRRIDCKNVQTPPNLRTTLPERPLSAARGRPGAPSPRSNSVDPGVPAGGRPRRQSCSPSIGRAPTYTSGSSVPAINRDYSKANDNVSPVLMGTKMVDRVVNMRKLAPPRPDEKGSPHGNLSAKSSSPDNAGFGRTLSSW